MSPNSHARARLKPGDMESIWVSHVSRVQVPSQHSVSQKNEQEGGSGSQSSRTPTRTHTWFGDSSSNSLTGCLTTDLDPVTVMPLSTVSLQVLSTWNFLNFWNLRCHFLSYCFLKIYLLIWNAGLQSKTERGTDRKKSLASKGVMQ